jgi:phosphopantetheinyl transferase (holo-ACP synthase)
VERIPDWGALSGSERELCAAAFPRLERYAGRIAAKRSVQRLLRDVLGEPPVSLRDIVIARVPDGRPRVVLRGRASDRSGRRRAEPIDVSITHRKNRAVALAATGGHVGVDLVERAFVDRADDDRVARLAARVLTPSEREADWFVNAPREGMLAALTAKEAVGKVLKREYPDISWHDVQLTNSNESLPAPVKDLACCLLAAVGPGVTAYGRATSDANFGGIGLWIVWVFTEEFAYAAARRGAV